MPLDITGQGSISGITSLNTSASVTLSETELGYLDGVTSGLQTQINTAGGLIKIVDQSFTSASAVSVNNCFTSTYENYKILIYYFSSSSSVNLQARLRASASDNTNSSYILQLSDFSGSSVTASRGTPETSWINFGASSTGDFNHLSADIFRPSLATRTHFTSDCFASISNAFIRRSAGVFDNTTVFDGITIFPGAGNITGNIRVYGYRN